MTSSPSSPDQAHFFEQIIEKYPKLCTTLAFLLILVAMGLAARIDPESEQIAAQQNADTQAWEQGYAQGRQTELNRCARLTDQKTR